MTPVTIGVVSVVSGSAQVSKVTMYTFSYTVKNKFLANGKVKIGNFNFNLGLPSEISWDLSLSGVFSITHTNSTVIGDQSCVVSNYSINSVQYLELSGISSTNLSASTIITLKISSLINPSSLKPSSSFTFYQVDSNGFEVEKL